MKHINRFDNMELFEAVKESLARPHLARVGEISYILRLSAGPTVEMVDLGLESGTLWAKYNLGATGDETPESWYGDYYAWGETETKSDYSWSTYKYCEGSYNTLTKYNTDSTYGTVDNKTELELVDDVVNTTLGGNYRMPTDAEISELIALPNEWVENYKGVTGLNGRVFTGTIDNELFIPAAGGFGSGPNNIGSGCYLWSSLLYVGSTYRADYLDFSSDYIGIRYVNRCIGFSVRPVL